MENNLKLRVLLVEDSLLASKVASMILMNAGCVVEVAETGENAVAIVQNNPKKFDLILMDVGLPDMDGDRVAEKIKENIEARDIPIVALTAHDEESVRRRCMGVGMREILIKPLNDEKLRAVLQKYVMPSESLQ